MNRHAVVTGFGAVAPNGLDAEAFWDATLAGRSGVRRIESFDVTDFPVQVAGEVSGFTAADFVPSRKSLKIMGKNIRFGVAAAKMAADHAGITEEKPDPTRFGVVMGSGIVPTDVQEMGEAVMASLDDKGEFDVRLFGKGGQKMLFPLWL